MAVASFIVYLASIVSIVLGQRQTTNGSTREDPCLVGDYCGLNSICHSNMDSWIECTCPPGFVFLDGGNHSKGCLRSPPQENCSQKCVMQDIGNTDWPGGAYEAIGNISESACKQACLEDCLCTVAVYGPPNRTSNCWKKRTPLTKGYTGADRAAFVKLFDPQQEEEEKQIGMHEIIFILYVHGGKKM